MLHTLQNPLNDELQTMQPSRRAFLKATAATGAGLVVGFAFAQSGVTPAHAAKTADDLFNPFVKIMPDNTVTVIVKHLDKGQGTATGLATLVADELDASVEQVRVEFAPSDPEVYKNLLFGVQGTGGSTAIANSFMQYREAGAAARAMLVDAAAEDWAVPAAEITVANGLVSHASGKSAPFGDLVAAARGRTAPESVTLKSPEDWVYIGKSFPRVDVPEKSRGAAGMFGMDVQSEDMVVAVLARPPKFGAAPKSFDASQAKKVRGVIDVVSIPQGVAVIAQSTWPAIKARDLLTVEWDDTDAESRSTEEIFAEHRRLAGEPGLVAHAHGDAAAGLEKAAKVVEAVFEFPFLAHAPMEPLDVTIRFDGDSATVWTGSQLQTMDHNVAAAILGLPMDKVEIVTLWAGGSFGRRAIYNAHYVAEAATLAKAWGKSQPIKIVWTREDDIKGGYYRPLAVHKVRAGIGEDGSILGWHHRAAGKSIMIGTPFEQFAVKDGVDHVSVEGLEDATYAIDGFQVEVHNTNTQVPVLWWRSVGHTHTAYAVETMIDKLAREAGRDPVEYRQMLLKDDPRKLGVLNLVAENADWGKPLEDGRYRGVAVHKSFNSYVAQIAEISMADGQVKVEKVWCAVDCGVPVNPDNIVAQMEGGIGFGLGAILRNEVTLTGGEVDQGNFDTYEPLRMTDMPDVEVSIVPSTEAPTGAGEPGTPPIGPAVANAIFAATGEHPTILPFSKRGLI